MSGALGNKETMAKNLSYYMDKNGVTRNKLSDDLEISYSTIRDWLKAKTYPRIDKIELLANYFGIEKSDLVEEKSKQGIETKIPIIIEEIKKEEIAKYGNKKYKLLYDPIFKKEITEKIENNYDFNGLTDIGIKQFTKEILDDLLTQKQISEKYTPYNNENALNYSYDILWETIAKIDDYFREDNELGSIKTGLVKNSELKKELSPKIYSEIRVAFEDLSLKLSKIEIDDTRNKYVE